MTARTSSGSRRSAWAVNPTRSVKTTVTILRSSARSARAVGAATAPPHDGQYAKVASRTAPHDGHVRTTSMRRSYDRLPVASAGSTLPAVRMTIENTAVVLDSTGDLPDARERHPNWRVVAQHVHLGDVSYRDHVELSPAEFYRRLREDAVVPRTAQATPADFEEAF